MSDSTPAIIDLSDKGPDCREWQELERYVREYASRIVREIMASESAPSAPPTDTGKGNLKTQHEREREKELIRQGLERYRTEPPDSNIRKCIDWLLQRHARWERFMQSDPLFRKRQITQKGQGKMENLKKVIEQTERQLSQAKEKRQTADVEQFAELDKEILRMELHLKRLKESEHLQELREKGQTPTDTFTQAKLHVIELVDQLSDEMVDMNGSDPRLISSFRLVELIDQLELLKMASQPTDAKFQPNADFTGQFNAFITAKNEKVKSAREKIAAQDMEIQHIETLLADATAAGNPEEILAYSDSLENARRTREYLEPMLQEAEQSETFPAGTISTAWKEICNLYRHEYLLRIEIINAAQNIHLRACNELIGLANNLRGLRSEIQHIGKENGSPDEIERYNAQITNGADLSKIKEIRRNQYEGLNRYIYYDKEKLL